MSPVSRVTAVCVKAVFGIPRKTTKNKITKTNFLFFTSFRIANISFNINFFTIGFFEIAAWMLDASFKPPPPFDFDRFLEFGHMKWKETSVHHLHRFFTQIESAPMEALFQSWEQPEIAWCEVRWVGRMRSNMNIIRLEVLHDDSGGMRSHIVMMEIAILQLRSLPTDMSSKSFQNITVVLGIHPFEGTRCW